MSVTEDQIAAWEQLARDISHPARASEWAFQLRDAVLTMVARLRSLTTPSPAGTVRLLYPNGTHRDVSPGDEIPTMLPNGRGDTVERVRFFHELRDDGTIDVARDWNTPHGHACSEWVEARFETYAEEAARERAARIEAERQRDEAQDRLDELKEEIERVRFLSQDVEREFNPLNCVDVGLLIERLKRERDEAKAQSGRAEKTAKAALRVAVASRAFIYRADEDCALAFQEASQALWDLGIDPDTGAELGSEMGRGASPAPASAPLRERLGRLVWATVCSWQPHLRCRWDERAADLRRRDVQIGEAVFGEAERIVAESLRATGARLVRSADPEDQARGAAYLTAAREVAAGQHRELKGQIR